MLDLLSLHHKKYIKIFFFFLQTKQICPQVPRRRTRENRAPRRGRPRERPAGNRDPSRDRDPVPVRDRDRDRDRVLVRVHHPSPDRDLVRARLLDRTRVLARVRRPSHAANRAPDPAVLNPGTRRDPDPSRDRARERLRSHRRDLGRVHDLDPSRDRARDRDPRPVAVADPPARAAKAARKASESRRAIIFLL